MLVIPVKDGEQIDRALKAFEKKILTNWYFKKIKS